MKHLDDGALRRLLDEPFALSPDARMHVDSCAECRRRLDVVAGDRDYAFMKITSPNASVDIAAARYRIPAVTRRRGWPTFRFNSPRLRRIPAVGALVAIALIGTTVASGAAQALLAQFQPSQIVPLYIDRGEFSGLPNLSKFGTFTRPNNIPAVRTSSRDKASSVSGMHVLTPSVLPSGTPAEVSYQILPAETASFQLSAAKTKRYAKASGIAIPAMPPPLNGSRLELRTHSAVVTIYGANGEIPSLVIGQTVAPTLSVSGASLQYIESYLATIPSIPKHLINQLKALSSPTNALPIPVPVNWAYGQRITVHGSPGLVVGDNTGVASVVIWEKNRVVYGVGGTITKDQAIQTADSLR